MTDGRQRRGTVYEMCTEWNIQGYRIKTVQCGINE